MENDSPIRIALVDDHLKLRTAIAEYLKNFKYKVIWQAANGIEALEAIERHTEKPHVCILDINMPEMDGIETAKQLTLHFPMVKILAFSGNGDDASVLQMLKAGVKGYLLKGGEAIEIKRAIGHLLEDEYYFSEPIRGLANRYLDTNQNIKE